MTYEGDLQYVLNISSVEYVPGWVTQKNWSGRNNCYCSKKIMVCCKVRLGDSLFQATTVISEVQQSCRFTKSVEKKKK